MTERDIKTKLAEFRVRFDLRCIDCESERAGIRNAD
jgi:hypothetical protein